MATAMTMEMPVLYKVYPITVATTVAELPGDLPIAAAEPVPEAVPALHVCVVESKTAPDDVPQSRLLSYAKICSEFIHFS